LAGETEYEASWDEGSKLRKESAKPKSALAQTMLENRLFKKRCSAVRRGLDEIPGP